MRPELQAKNLSVASYLRNHIRRNESVWGSGCIDPRFLHLDTSWTRMPLYPR
jgi:hypothetical protein